MLPRFSPYLTIAIISLLLASCDQKAFLHKFVPKDDDAFARRFLDAIRAGTVAASNEGMAKAGMILGIVGTVLLGLSCVWMFFGGMAVLSGISS